MEEKTYVEDIDRSLYDFRNEDKDAYRIEEGLTREIVEQISREKHDPEWMRELPASFVPIIILAVHVPSLR